MSIVEKMTATEFTEATAKSFDEVLALGSKAAEHATGMVTQVKIANVGESSFEVLIRRAGMANVGVLKVTYRPEEQGGTVLLRVADYLISQSKIFIFIPVGPKDAAAYPATRTFSEALKKAL